MRDLLVLEQGGRGGHKEATFLLDPRVAERSENSTFAVCEAVQALGGQAVYEDVVARAGVHIVYPPQVGRGGVHRKWNCMVELLTELRLDSKYIWEVSS